MQLSDKARAVKESSTLAISAKAKAMKAQGLDIISFGAGEPDFDTPVHIKAAAITAINEGYTKYTPSSGALELRSAICRKLKRENGLDYEPGQIVVSNGAKHSLANIFNALLSPGDEVIIPVPYWLSYPEMVKLAGGVPVFVQTTAETAFKAAPELLEPAFSARTKAIIINSPNNPSGMVCSRDELLAIGRFAVERGVYIISDEIYEHLIYDGGAGHISVAALGDDIRAHTVVVNGLSKSYSMTGWRVGYTASPKALAEAMGSIQSHCASNANSIAQRAAIAALDGDQDCVEEMRLEFARRRDYIYGRVSAMPRVSMLKPEGAFYAFIDCSGLCGQDCVPAETADGLAALLLEKAQIAVVPCADFGFDNYLRLSYAIAMEDIERGLDRLERFVIENYG